VCDAKGIPTFIVTAVGATTKEGPFLTRRVLRGSDSLQVALRAKANTSPAGEAF